MGLKKGYKGNMRKWFKYKFNIQIGLESDRIGLKSV